MQLRDRNSRKNHNRFLSGEEEEEEKTSKNEKKPSKNHRNEPIFDDESRGRRKRKVTELKEEEDEIPIINEEDEEEDHYEDEENNEENEEDNEEENGEEEEEDEEEKSGTEKPETRYDLREKKKMKTFSLEFDENNNNLRSRSSKHNNNRSNSNFKYKSSPPKKEGRRVSSRLIDLEEKKKEMKRQTRSLSPPEQRNYDNKYRDRNNNGRYSLRTSTSYSNRSYDETPTPVRSRNRISYDETSVRTTRSGRNRYEEDEDRNGMEEIEVVESSKRVVKKGIRRSLDFDAILGSDSEEEKEEEGEFESGEEAEEEDEDVEEGEKEEEGVLLNETSNDNMEEEGNDTEEEQVNPRRPGLRPRRENRIYNFDSPRSKGGRKTKARRSGRERRETQRWQPAPSASKSRPFEVISSRFSAASDSGRRRRRSSFKDADSSSSSDDDLGGLLTSSHSSKSKMGLDAHQPINMSKMFATSKADIDPMEIDPNINWDSIGGLDHHIQSLKEMIVFPLLYPEIYERFSMTPPKGVLFYGPPGTGKTLVARALANMCSSSGQPVAFFMRKGADCLSKWVGEAERQLRLLFQQAHAMQPSIIFFDEIDGLAPVRSAKQDQIHSSIVSTLLALMDGLDNRGQIVVIGATNRIDSIDPALRRPGRFDREFLFTLPSQEDRRKIIKIHTKAWKPPLDPLISDSIADRCIGYCGADIRSLTVEATLRTLRRTYPQIYDSKEKLLIDVNKLTVTKSDFISAMNDIVPTAHRSSLIYAKPLDPIIIPLLERQIDSIYSLVERIFPVKKTSGGFFGNSNAPKSGKEEEDDEDRLVLKAYDPSSLYRPRLLISGDNGMYQSSIASAILYKLEQFPVSSIDTASLVSNPVARSTEEAFVIEFKEALRKVPSIVFLPHINSWWDQCSLNLRSTFEAVMSDLDPTLPILLLATADCSTEDLPPELKQIFSEPHQSKEKHSNVKQILIPNEYSRRKFFESFLEDGAKYESGIVKKPKPLPVLPKAPVQLAQKSTEDRKRKKSEDAHFLRELRIFLREIISVVHKERRYNFFFKAPNELLYPRFCEAVNEPMDLSKMMAKVDNGEYLNLQGFLDDATFMLDSVVQHADLLVDRPGIEHRAKSLQDIIFSLAHEIDAPLNQNCNRIFEEEKEYLKNNPTPPPPKPKEPLHATRSKGPIKEPEPAVQEEEEEAEENEEEEKTGEEEEDEEVMMEETPKASEFDGSQEESEEENEDEVEDEVEITFDSSKAEKYLVQLVKSTSNSTIEEMVSIRAAIYQIINKHKSNADKTQMLKDISRLFSESFES
eukprot:TRINITY_DN1240_c0_g1_i10.p1 TRINITY_DN1240_c0_g1~~TRINITY_DN1240_c0_g1_i10.p1  ORF type:complete len:1298 (+),score=512.73 TRINITY_DN1240_c0_g1_i10:287-4180(+)